MMADAPDKYPIAYECRSDHRRARVQFLASRSLFFEVAMECRKCHEHKPRKMRVVYGGYQRWFDDNNKLWNGRTCPECRIRDSKRRNINAYVGRVKPAITSRKCRKCAGPLPVTRYFNCLDCQLDLPYDIAL